MDELVVIHQRVISAHGGSVGIRDRGLLESAASVPAAQFSGQYLHVDVPTMAAAYLFHLCKNHPFLDGNKRVALAAADVFLELNDYQLSASDDELEKLTLSVADSSTSKEAAVAFFQAHARSAPSL
ncbi:MAG: type II toxin-antitoxin system death-on-curing family toxin [Planctomycetaceae bacterium]